MTIIRRHLKIFKPERLGSAPNAGGHRTSKAVISGKLNDVFSSISDVDHARSAFDLVKLYPAVATDDATRLQDAHVFISDQPDDPLVCTLLVESPQLRDDSLLDDMLPMMTSSGTKYHGTSYLTSTYESGDFYLTIRELKRSLAPSVTRSETKQGLRPQFDDAGDVTGYRYKKIESFGNLSEFSIDIPDLLLDYTRVVLRHNSWSSLWRQPVINGTVVSGEVYEGRYLPNGTVLWIYYLSNLDFRFHSFSTSQNITLGATETVVKGTVKLRKLGSSQIVTDDGNGRFIHSGYVIATIDYDTGVITEVESIDYSGTVEEELGALIQLKPLSIRELDFTLPSQSFARDSVYIRAKSVSGTEFSASSDANGTITGTNISGSVSSSGTVSLTFAVDMVQESITYDYDELIVINVPSPPGGISRHLLPEGGFVPIFHEFNLVCVQDRERSQHASLSSGQQISVSANANWVDIVDNNNLSLYSANDDNYSYDKSTGKVTIKSDISGFSGPFIITVVHSELVLVDAIEGDKLRILSPLQKTYPVGATVSSVYVLGDLQATTLNERTLSAWQNDFGATGSPASSAINVIQYPIELSNIGCIAQRWALVFTTATEFKVIGEHVGVVYQGSINLDCSPINPFSEAPYFFIQKEAFGVGLNPGECFLFETTAASKPIMLTRSVSPGHTDVIFDSSTMAFRGNKE
ncbi:hypothetical protein ACSLBF_10555 [Pseudoalteromonas sp. T1lg65]|uniref:hypothetical protein n=1 Tax=Pseudoalteromonas sp. T1lg65 TaxID=2077101 RepID=UPI003F7A9E39